MTLNPNKLNDEELSKHPRVKNLFNQFWEEKMKELGGRNINLGNKQQNRSSVKNIVQSPPAVKSPSDTTIYAPALNKVVTAPLVIAQNTRNGNHHEILSNTYNDVEINLLISNFAESVPLEQREQSGDGEAGTSLQEKERRKASAGDPLPGFEEARDWTSKAVVEAEKFRASIVNPGNNPSNHRESGLNADFIDHRESMQHQIITGEVMSWDDRIG